MAQIYGFECMRFGHAIDHWVDRCPQCGAAVSAVYESPESRAAARDARTLEPVRPHFNAQRFKPVVYHKHKSGRISWPGSDHAPVRPGYERCEARTLREIDQAVKTVNRQELDKAEQHQHREEIREAARREEFRPALRQRMQTMSPRGRALAQLAMDRNDARRPVKHDPNVHLEIREFDASNRDGYEDKSTGWKTTRV